MQFLQHKNILVIKINEIEREVIDMKKYCFAPVAGKIVDLNMVNDPVFANKIIGDGVAIIPYDDVICAPITGVIKLIFHTGHAFVIEGADGDEIMVHIGINTVQYQGNGFTILSDQGNTIEAGTPIVAIDRNILKDTDLTTMVIILDENHAKEIEKIEMEECHAGNDIIFKW